MLSDNEAKKKVTQLEKGINKIKKLISKGKTKEDKVELALQYKQQLETLQKEYRITRSQYDILYFTYEYFSVERNQENDNNLIPKGVKLENAPQFHKELCEMLEDVETNNPTQKTCFSYPRGHCKTMYGSNVFPIHNIIFKRGVDGGRKYILIISETQKMAQEFIIYIADQLKFNKKLRGDFGVFLHENKIANVKDNSMEFVTLNDIKVQSASINSQLRGARHKSYRPDLIVCDDLESRTNTNTLELRDKNLHWYNSVIEPIGTPERTAIVYLGTMVHGQGLLPNIMARPSYKSRRYPAYTGEPKHPELWEQFNNILENLEDSNRLEKAFKLYEDNKHDMDEGIDLLWKERYTFADLMKIKNEVGSRAFASEYMNIASDEDSLLFNVNNFTYYDTTDILPKNLDIYSFWDVAIGKNSRSDYNAIVTIGRDRRTGIIYVLDAWGEKIPAHKALEVAYQKIITYKPRVFAVEAIQAQYEYYRQLMELCRQRGAYIAIKPIYSKGKKEERIEVLEPLFENGTIRVKRQFRLLLEQLEFFPNGDHDDLPDALAGAIELAGNRRTRHFYKKPEGI